MLDLFNYAQLSVAGPMENLEEDFARFWLAYPRKEAKLDALKAFRMVARQHGIKIEQILAAVERYRARIIEDDTERKFVKLPAGWLRSGRWMDEEHETIKPEPVVRPAKSLEELMAYLRDIGKPIPREVSDAYQVGDLPTFLRMIPTAWRPKLKVVA